MFESLLGGQSPRTTWRPFGATSAGRAFRVRLPRLGPLPSPSRLPGTNSFWCVEANFRIADDLLPVRFGHINGMRVVRVPGDQHRSLGVPGCCAGAPLRDRWDAHFAKSGSTMEYGCPHCRLGSNSHERDERSTSVESLPVARTGSGSPADDRPKGTRQRHDDVLAYDGRV